MARSSYVVPTTFLPILVQSVETTSLTLVFKWITDVVTGVTIVQEDDFPAQLLLINSGVLNDPAQWTSPANAK